MYYFDRDFLAQYLDQGHRVRVFVNYDWHEIASKRDLESEKTCVVIDDTGDATQVNYSDIEEIKVGNKHFTIAQLQAQFAGKEPEESEPKSGGGDTKDAATADAEPAEEEPEEEKEKTPGGDKGPDLSHYSPIYNLGRNIVDEWMGRHGR